MQSPPSFLEADPERQTDHGFNAGQDAPEREPMHKWDRPRSLYALAIPCSLEAVAQGGDVRVFQLHLLDFLLNSLTTHLPPPSSDRNWRVNNVRAL